MTAPGHRWLIALAGLSGGLLLGLAYAWLIDPVRPTDAYPALLGADHRLDWMRVALLSFVADGDIDRLRERLDGFEQDDLRAGLRTAITSAWDTGTAGQLMGPARMAADVFGLPLPTQLVPNVVDAAATRYTAPGFSKPGFRVVERQFACRADGTPRLEVIARDPAGQELPGVRLWLLSEGGIDRAFTGLKPQRGPGYADFRADDGVRYALGVGSYGMPLLSDLIFPECESTDAEQTDAGIWRVVLETRLDPASPVP